MNQDLIAYILLGVIDGAFSHFYVNFRTKRKEGSIILMIIIGAFIGLIFGLLVLN